MPHADPVTFDVRMDVLRRDGQCMAQLLGFTHECRDQWDWPHAFDDLGRMQLDHVKDAPRMGRRAPSDPLHLITLCAFAHERWATSNRPIERAYLRRIEMRLDEWTDDGDVTSRRYNISSQQVAASVLREATT